MAIRQEERLAAAEAVIRRLDDEYDLIFLPMRQGIPKWSQPEADAIARARDRQR